MSSIEERWARTDVKIGKIGMNRQRLDEALSRLTEAQIGTEDQFRETASRTANLTNVIGHLIVEMRSRPN